MTDSVVVPAGWYPDPTGRHQHRYWQGATWTELVSDAGCTSNDPPVVVPPLPGVPGAPVTSPDGPVPGPPFDRPAPPDTGALPDTEILPDPPAPAGGPLPTLIVSAPAAWAPPSGPPAAVPPPPGPHGMPLPPPGYPVDPLAAQPSPGPRRRWWIWSVAIVGVLLLVSGVGTWVISTRPGPSPVGLAALKVTSGSASLVWLPPRAGKRPQRYVVQRDGVEVTRTTGDTSYTDTDLSALTDYRYRVLAVVEGKLSSPTAEIVVHTLPESPRGLASGEVTMTSVVVNWSAPSGPRPDSYIVLRNGSEAATLSADTLTYKDTSLTPMTDTGYTVIAVTRGQRSDPTPTLAVTTLAPPVADARLQHSWDVTVRITKSTGSRAKVGLTDTGNWIFAPKCAIGACTVEVSGDLAGRPFSMTLNRSGALYKGSGKAHIARCGTKDISNNLNLTVKVTAGDISDSTWTASNWTGNLALSIPYTTSGNYYCPAQTITFAVSPDDVTADPTT